jgi:general secretion pathway protein M
MTERLQNWWIALSQRERWLVGIAGVLALGVVLWGLGRPAVAAFIDLESQHRAAIEREGRVAAKVQLLAQRPRNRSRRRSTRSRSTNIWRSRRAKSA